MINTIGHEALIYISTELMGAKERLLSILENIRINSSVVAVSTIYRRSTEGRAREDYEFSVELVCRVRTRLDVIPLKKELDLLLGDRVHINLLAYDDLISMTPQLTLPWPELHIESLIIRAASEVYPEYFHPVMKEKLIELATKQTVFDSKIEFFMQGRALCDF